jgi:hypothetical protein
VCEGLQNSVVDSASIEVNLATRVHST